MANNLTSNTHVSINTSVEKVWQALTDPELIKKYLFGTNTVSSWEEGSSITYSGEWEGKAYEDKGKIIKIIPKRLLHTTYFSSMSKKEDKPENYANVIYKIEPANEGAIVSISQNNIENEEQLNHMNQNWSMVLNNMKKLLEG